MPVIDTPVTSRWSGTKWSGKSWNITVTEGWNVIPAATKDAAIALVAAAVGAPNSGTLVGLPHPDNQNLICDSCEATNEKGPFSFIVTANFKFGIGIGQGASTPVDEPPKLSWDEVTRTVATEYDDNGNPIVNAAGQPFDPPETKEVVCLVLNVVKWLPVFNISNYSPYINCVNSDNPLTIAGAGVATIGQCCCRSIKPTQMYTMADLFVETGYRFEFLPGSKPWQAYPVNRGRSAWYSGSGSGGIVGSGGGSPKLGPICDGSGNPVNFDVRLDKYGIPMLMVGGAPAFHVLDETGAMQPIIANPTPPKGLVVDPTRSTTGAYGVTVLEWDVKGSIEMAGLI